MGAKTVTKKNIAELLFVHPRTVDQWITRRIFPAPIGSVRGDNGRPHLVWEWQTIKTWAKETGRL